MIHRYLTISQHRYLTISQRKFASCHNRSSLYDKVSAMHYWRWIMVSENVAESSTCPIESWITLLPIWSQTNRPANQKSLKLFKHTDLMCKEGLNLITFTWEGRSIDGWNWWLCAKNKTPPEFCSIVDLTKVL